MFRTWKQLLRSASFGFQGSSARAFINTWDVPTSLSPASSKDRRQHNSVQWRRVAAKKPGEKLVCSHVCAQSGSMKHNLNNCLAAPDVAFVATLALLVTGAASHIVHP